MIGNNFLIWENDDFVIKTPHNPHQSYAEGLHLIVNPKIDLENAWANPEIAAQAFGLSAQACRIMEDISIAPWFNIQANGNWGLLPGGQKFFHIHIYGRNHTDSWGKPLVLPELPNTYQHEPMPAADRGVLIEAFRQLG